MLELEKHKEPMVDKFISNFIAAGLFIVFAVAVGFALVIAFFQVGANGEYAAEYTGIVNNVIVYLLGVFSGVIGVLYGIKQEDMNKNIAQSATLSKEIGAVKFAEMDELAESPDTDNN